MGKRTGYSSSRAVRKLKDGGESADTIARTFARHHGPRLKAILARTLKATDDIGACAVAAGIANVALVNVCNEDSCTVTVSVNDSSGWRCDRDTERRKMRIRRLRVTVCEMTFTSDATSVQSVSHGTFTPERAVCVDALAINTRVIEALVNIWS